MACSTIWSSKWKDKPQLPWAKSTTKVSKTWTTLSLLHNKTKYKICSKFKVFNNSRSSITVQLMTREPPRVNSIPSSSAVALLCNQKNQRAHWSGQARKTWSRVQQWIETRAVSKEYQHQRLTYNKTNSSSIRWICRCKCRWPASRAEILTFSSCQRTEF